MAASDTPPSGSIKGPSLAASLLIFCTTSLKPPKPPPNLQSPGQLSPPSLLYLLQPHPTHQPLSCLLQLALFPRAAASVTAPAAPAPRRPPARAASKRPSTAPARRRRWKTRSAVLPAPAASVLPVPAPATARLRRTQCPATSVPAARGRAPPAPALALRRANRSWRPTLLPRNEQLVLD